MEATRQQPEVKPSDTATPADDELAAVLAWLDAGAPHDEPEHDPSDDELDTVHEQLILRFVAPALGAAVDDATLDRPRVQVFLQESTGYPTTVVAAAVTALLPDAPALSLDELADRLADELDRTDRAEQLATRRATDPTIDEEIDTATRPGSATGCADARAGGAASSGTHPACVAFSRPAHAADHDLVGAGSPAETHPPAFAPPVASGGGPPTSARFGNEPPERPAADNHGQSARATRATTPTAPPVPERAARPRGPPAGGVSLLNASQSIHCDRRLTRNNTPRAALSHTGRRYVRTTPCGPGITVWTTTLSSRCLRAVTPLAPRSLRARVLGTTCMYEVRTPRRLVRNCRWSLTWCDHDGGTEHPGGGAMAAPEHYVDPFEHAGPWTEEDFLALPVDRRVELVDGSLVVSPSGSNRHQKLAFRLCAALDAAAPAGWEVLESVNVRLLPGRILIPDVAVLQDADRDATVNDVTRLRLAVEVVSPGNAAMDRVLKPHLYAQAGIARYLRVERHDGGAGGHLHALEGDTYCEITVSSVVQLDVPFPVVLDLATLAR